MPGIAGVLYPDIFQMTGNLESMLRGLLHRGSSQEKRSVQNLHIGAVGTSIGSNENNTVIALIDGKVTKKQTLIDDLQQAGRRVSKNSGDADLIAKAYECWQADFIQRVMGDFSLAVIDIKRRCLLISRDRIGRKPLYWYHDHQHFLFATELKSLLLSNLVAPTPASDALATFLSLGYIPQDLSPIEGVSKLLPGHTLRIDFQGGKTVKPYWSYASHFQNQERDENLGETIDKLLRDSLEARLTHTEKSCTFISGGLGSASIATYARRAGVQNAYTCIFQGQNDDDAVLAKEVATHTQMEHKVRSITADSMLNGLVGMVWVLDEPIADPCAVATALLAEMAATEGFSHVISGMGCDELFAGHTRYHDGPGKIGFAQALSQFPSWVIERLLIPILMTVHRRFACDILRHLHVDQRKLRFLENNALFDQSNLKQVSKKLAHFFSPAIFLQRFHRQSRVGSDTASYLYFDIKTRLADLYIMQYERLTSAFNLHWIAPFLDCSVIQYLAGIPMEDKSTRKEHAIALRQLMKERLPRRVLERPKVERPHFLAGWYRHPALQECFGLLKQGMLVDAGLIERAWLDRNLPCGTPSYLGFRRMWALLILEIWFRLFVGNPLTCRIPKLKVKDFLEMQI